MRIMPPTVALASILVSLQLGHVQWWFMVFKQILCTTVCGVWHKHLVVEKIIPTDAISKRVVFAISKMRVPSPQRIGSYWAWAWFKQSVRAAPWLGENDVIE